MKSREWRKTGRPAHAIDPEKRQEYPGNVPAVLVVGNGLTGGGAEARLSRLVPRLFGGRVDLALLTGGHQPDAPCGGEVFYLGWKSRLSYPRLVLKLWRIVKNRQYDVVMSFGLFPVAITSLVLMGTASKPKFIVSEITRPDAAGPTENSLRQWIYYWLRRKLYRRGDLITANSIDGVIETCRLADAKLAVRLPNIVDVDRLGADAAREIIDSISFRRYIICIGRLVTMKRINTVLEALARIVRRVDCGLVIVGDGVARQALEAQVQGMGLQESVMFTGRLENPLPVLKRASALVLASEYEGFSNSVLEAMFCDVPVITSYCSSDAREMCEQGAALGFEVGDAEQLGEHIVSIVTDEALGQGLVQRAREYRAPHAMDRAIPVYEDLILRVAGYEGSWR